MICLCMGWERVVCGGGRKFLVLEIKIKQRWEFIYFLGPFWGQSQVGSGLKGNDFKIFSLYVFYM